MLSDLKNKIEEFDCETALEFCGEDEDFLAELLTDFANSGKDEELEKSFAAKDWKSYALSAHSLKGTSRTVGFPKLGNLCEALQFAAQKADGEFVESHHDAMLETLKEYNSIIKETFE